MSNETIARRYASALADVVSKSGETETVRGELKEWERIIADSPDLYAALSNPAIAQDSKEKVLESLIAKAQPAHTTANFLRVLLRNGRVTLIDEINERFAAELEERSGFISAEVTSARILPDPEKAALKANLENLTGKKVNINYSINSDIIGGVITRIGSTVYDGSVKTQLENLRQELIGS